MKKFIAAHRYCLRKFQQTRNLFWFRAAMRIEKKMSKIIFDVA